MVELLVVAAGIGVVGAGMIGGLLVGAGERWRIDATLLLLLWLVWFAVTLVVLSVAVGEDQVKVREGVAAVVDGRSRPDLRLRRGVGREGAGYTLRGCSQPLGAPVWLGSGVEHRSGARRGVGGILRGSGREC